MRNFRVHENNQFRLNLFNEAEMRRSRLVERATTDEDEELDSWGRKGFEVSFLKFGNPIKLA